MQYLYDKLKEYSSSDYYPYHMPGHKRSISMITDLYKIDLTEIEGFDNLHHPEDILKEAQERAAALYCSQESYFLVNGSTAGILSAISACTSIGGKVLVARNCHKAVYHSLLIRNLQVQYIYPQEIKQYGLNGGLAHQEIERYLIDMPEIQAVIITSPTYDGVVSDVKKIADIVHRYRKPLIVDEAHGAHFGFHPYFPKSSVMLGADAVIHSLHKTLPSFTQTALLHINGSLIDREAVRRYLGVFQTSSPSYILMAGMDHCIRMLTEDKEHLFNTLADHLQTFRNKFLGLKHIRLFDPEMLGKEQIYDLDRSKLLFLTADLPGSGRELHHVLRNRFHLEMEMSSLNYVLALTSVADRKEGFDRLLDAMLHLDSEWKKAVTDDRKREAENRVKFVENEAVMGIYEAECVSKKSLPLLESSGETAGEFLYLYPPGIPFLVPGERISEHLVEKIRKYQKQGYIINGMKDMQGKSIQVLDLPGAERKSNGKNILCNG